jgi:hypothetical protein
MLFRPFSRCPNRSERWPCRRENRNKGDQGSPSDLPQSKFMAQGAGTFAYPPIMPDFATGQETYFAHEPG